MTIVEPITNYKQNLKNSMELETYIEEQETIGDKEFEIFWEMFYPRVHAKKERTIEEFAQILEETYEKTKEKMKDIIKKKGEPDFNMMKKKLDEIRESILKELENCYEQLQLKKYPFRVCLAFIDTLKLMESTFDIILHQIKIRFAYRLRTRTKRIQKAEQVSRVVVGHMFLIFRMGEICDLLERNAPMREINEYLTYLSKDITQFSKFLIRFNFIPKITEDETKLIEKYGDVISFLVKNA